MTNCVNSDGLFVIFESGLFESLSVPLELVYIFRLRNIFSRIFPYFIQEYISKYDSINQNNFLINCSFEKF